MLFSYFRPENKIHAIVTHGVALCAVHVFAFVILLYLYSYAKVSCAGRDIIGIFNR